MEVYVGPHDTKEHYTTGTGQLLTNVHEHSPDCDQFGCSIHAPSLHHMRNWPTNFRADHFGLMERICDHGIGHPDPDALGFIARETDPVFAKMVAIHGCCGCCKNPGGTT